MKLSLFLLFTIATLISSCSNSSQNSPAPKPLFRDPIYDGAADPNIVWNSEKNSYTMFYTNRRANLDEVNGVDWVHGTKIGMAESTDGGTTWKYAGEANIPSDNDSITFWAPEIIVADNVYHMFLTIVPGIFSDWRHPRYIVHYTSRNLSDWEFADTVQLASSKVIDADVFRCGDKWIMFYNNEAAGKSIFCSESNDLKNWVDCGALITDRGCEAPIVFAWQNRYFMIVDNWCGLAVYQSDDLKNWTRQPENILAEPGIGADDNVIGGHCDVVVSGDRAFIFYFTHPGRIPDADKSTADYRRSSIQVAELLFENNLIVCHRDNPTYINLLNN